MYPLSLTSRVLSIALVATFLPVPFADAYAATRSSSRNGDSDSYRSSNYRISKSAQRRLGSTAVKEFPIPILFNVTPRQITDTWGDARSNGRTHEGTDIFAPKGTPVVSPTKAIVTSIGKASLGGNYVYTANPGGERYYFAHLDDYADGLRVGDQLDPGDIIGYVGNTGNASGGATHLHFGIYKRGATNPFERLTKEFTLKERIDSVEDMLKEAKDEDELADQLVRIARPYFIQAQAEGIELPDEILEAIVRAPAVPASSTSLGLDLDLGSSGDRVVLLQAFLIKQGTGPSAEALKKSGATGYFGALTQAALIEYQVAKGITPATGYFGTKTRATVALAGATI